MRIDTICCPFPAPLSWLLLFLWLLVLCSTATATTDSVVPRPSWWSCVRDIGMYFESSSATDFEWMTPNPCGFSKLSVDDVRSVIYFPKNSSTVAFAGDSTALRAYVYAVNSYLPPLNIPVIKKVASVPRVMTHVARGHYGGEDRATYATFFNMRYVSTSHQEIEEGILHSNGGVLVITIGNWDLNWKLQKNMPMPKLRGGTHNLEAAKAYWTEHVALMMANIARCLDLVKDAAKRPTIVFREQFLPNCDASRFTSKKARYRRCAPLIRPVVVPLYRRVLAPLAWSLNIPVIPMDHVFRDGYRYCSLSDGIHLDLACMMTEQQHIWNVVALLRRHRVQQGLGKANPEWTTLPDTRQFLNVTVFEAWRRRVSMEVTGVAATGTPSDIATAIAAENNVAVEESATAHPTTAVVEKEAPLALRVEYSSSTARPVAFGAHQGDHWSTWLIGTVVILGATVYLSRNVARLDLPDAS